ncbi:hypothetical protein KC19_1G036100 [Ceratodon purpureus]|uniref:Calcineurin-like phosphoesterase domain-containing protein n=1 Tax=Ceratodon purpureus TaxID=3225 RepID=A0A8T0J109_CERPU|nr:hypothetical protein KC19_1G036100 [Ceratodon purpureus]
MSSRSAVAASMNFRCIAWVGFLVWFVSRVVVGDHVRPVLRFNSDGTFKILQVADMHFAQGAQSQCFDVSSSHHCSDLNTTFFIERLLAAEKPDLVVFTGDNIDGGTAADAIKSMDQAFAPVIAAKIPWAAILGNHDQESNLPRAQVMDYLTKMDYSMSEILNPSMESLLGKNIDHTAPMEVHGYGNYYLQVFGALGSDSANSSLLNLYLLDSGDYSKFDTVGGYDWVRASQLLWFETLATKLRSAEASANTLLRRQIPPPVTPALAYFHIPIPEYNAVFMNPSTVVGKKQEVICSASVNSGLFTSLVEAGDVKATFVGHDHVNDYCGSLLGIHLCYGGGIGYHTYGKAGWARRARVVQASLGRGVKDGSKITREIVTWKIQDDEDLSMTDLQILYNGYAGEWSSKPIFGSSLSFRRRSGDSWIPSLTLLLLLTGLAGLSFLILFLVRKLQSRKRTNTYTPVEGVSSVESNDVYN